LFKHTQFADLLTHQTQTFNAEWPVNVFTVNLFFLIFLSFFFSSVFMMLWGFFLALSCSSLSAAPMHAQTSEAPELASDTTIHETSAEDVARAMMDEGRDMFYRPFETAIECQSCLEVLGALLSDNCKRCGVWTHDRYPFVFFNLLDVNWNG
jgi:hypothetical protein